MKKNLLPGFGLMVAFLTANVLPCQGSTCTWTNTSGGTWDNSDNWSPNQVPGSNDTAVITAAGTYIVTLDVSPTVAGLSLGASTSATTQSLVWAGYTLTVNGPIQVSSNGQFNLSSGALAGTSVLTGTLTWSGGSLSGNLTLATNSVMNIVAGGGLAMSGLVLTNYGTVNWTNTTLYSQSPGNAQIYNYGLWNAQSDNTFFGGYGGGSTLFDNFGMFAKPGNAGITTLDGSVVFNNTGTVNVQNGTLNINGGGTTSGGHLITSGAAILNFASYIFTNTNTFTGTGSFVAAGATFGGTIVGTLGWDGGSLTGVLTVATNSVMNIVAGGGLAMSGLVLTNYGTVNWTNTTLYSQSPANAQIYNYGLWNAQSDNSFYGGYGGGSTLFDNFGMFAKPGNSGITTLDNGVVFNNTGTVSVQNGTLDIGGGTTSGGHLVTSGAAILNFSSFILTNTNTFTGTGSFVTGGTTFGGTIIGTLGWDGGSISGNLTLATNSVLDIVAGGGNAMSGLVLTNYGTVNWTNTTLYSQGSANAQIYNYGVWNAQSDNDFNGGYGGGSTLFDNFGTFIKSGNAGTTTLDNGVVFNNTGTVSSDSGTLAIQGGGLNSGSGTFATTNGGLLVLDGITFATNATITSSTVVNLGGNTLVNGILTAPQLQLVGGTFSGTNVLIGSLTWSGGSLSGNLTLATNSVMNIVAGGGLAMSGLVLTNYGTVNWTNTTLYSQSPANAQIYNYGLWNAQSDNTFFGGYSGGSTLFDNFGTFLKSGNTGITTLDGSVVFNNTGTVNVQNGTLNIKGGGTTSGGNLITSGDGILNFYSYIFTNTNTFTGTGSFVAAGATFGGTIVGTLGWDGGSLTGILTVATNSVLDIVAGGGNAMSGLVLTNYGTVNWTNTTIYSQGSANAQIYNYGVWNAQSDNTFFGGYGGGSTLFDNLGMFVKSGNVGTTTLDNGVVFNNTGTLSAQSGNISLNGTYNLSGGTLNFGINSLSSYGTISLAGAAPLTGTITANLNNGYLPAIGNAFTVLYYGSPASLFTGAALPLPDAWTTNYTATHFYLQVLETGPVPLLLLNPRYLSPGNFNFLIGTVYGLGYTVELNTNLDTTNWTFYTNLTGNGAPCPVVSVDTNHQQLYFRVLEP